jgi:hypothetical protein
VDVSQVAVGGTATATAPSLTTRVANTMLVDFLTKRQEVLPAPVGTTPRWGFISGNGTGAGGVTAGDLSFAGPGATGPRISTSSTGFQAEWIAQTIALRRPAGVPSAALTWTATTSTWATGYLLEVVTTGQTSRQVAGTSTTATTEGPLVNGTPYTFRLTTYLGTWRSTPASVLFTPAC